MSGKTSIPLYMLHAQTQAKGKTRHKTIMGCVHSSSVDLFELKPVETIANPVFEDSIAEDILECRKYCENMKWCSFMSKYLESRIFVMAQYSAEEMALVRKDLVTLLKRNPTDPAYLEVKRWLASNDVCQVYLTAMHSVRMYATMDKTEMFKKVASAFSYVVRAPERANQA
jgi:hypothetical protein